MAAPDKVFQQVYAWYKASIDRLLVASPIAEADRPAVELLIWQALGVVNAAAPPASPDLTDFHDNGAAAESLSIACEVIAESLAALGYVKQALDALGPGGNPVAALTVVGPVMQQIDRLVQLQANSRYPSAFSIGKMLLMLTGDAQAVAPATHEADKLAALPSSVMKSRRPSSNMARPSFCRLASNGRSSRWNVHPQKHEQKNEDRIDNDPHDIRGPTTLPLLYSPLAHAGSPSLGPENVCPARSACNRAQGRSLGKT